jgi:hypothetical protein
MRAVVRKGSRHLCQGDPAAAADPANDTAKDTGSGSVAGGGRRSVVLSGPESLARLISRINQSTRSASAHSAIVDLNESARGHPLSTHRLCTSTGGRISPG